VSKVTKRHCAGTVQSQGGRVWNVKQLGFESRPEDSYGRCRRDMIRETVPDTSSGLAHWALTVFYHFWILIPLTVTQF